jgi:hypothetical protein
MATKKQQQATRASAQRTAKGRPAQAGQVNPIATGAARQVESPSAEVAEMGTTSAPEPAPAPTPAPATAETPTHVDEGPNRTAGAKKLSALDAAVRVLEESGQAMNCQELIAAMAAQGYWSSPRGRSPSSTLYSAILRELQSQGEQARFVKTQRGRFARRRAV